MIGPSPQHYCIRAACLLLCLAVQGCGGYRAFLRDWRAMAPESRLPPPSAQSAATAAVQEGARQPPVARGGQAPAFPDIAGPNPVFVPDPERLRQLRPAAENDEEAAAVLAAGFTLDDLLLLITLRNPALRGAEETYRATLARYDQATALDDLLQRYAAFTQGIEPGAGSMGGRTPLGLQFPAPGIVSLRGEIARQEILEAFERLQASRRGVIAAGRRACWELHYAGRELALARQSLVLYAGLRQTVATRYEAGQEDMQPLLRVDAELSRIAARIPVLAAGVGAQEEVVRALVVLPAAARIGTPAVPAAVEDAGDVQALAALALEERQELRQLRAAVRRAELFIELAETAAYPGLSLNLSLPVRNEVMAATGEGGRPETFALATPAATGAGQPLSPAYGIDSAYLQEARRDLLALRQELRRAEADSRRDVHAAWYRLDRAVREEAVARARVLPLAKAEFDSAAAGYGAGNAVFAEMIGAADRWLGARLEWERRRADVGIAAADLDEVVGARSVTGREEGR
ncbi:MAG: TolC family protein [Thermodesulfobacteriota bacterium]